MNTKLVTVNQVLDVGNKTQRRAGSVRMSARVCAFVVQELIKMCEKDKRFSVHKMFEHLYGYFFLFDLHSTEAIEKQFRYSPYIPDIHSTDASRWRSHSPYVPFVKKVIGFCEGNQTLAAMSLLGLSYTLFVLIAENADSMELECFSDALTGPGYATDQVEKYLSGLAGVDQYISIQDAYPLDKTSPEFFNDSYLGKEEGSEGVWNCAFDGECEEEAMLATTACLHIADRLRVLVPTMAGPAKPAKQSNRATSGASSATAVVTGPIDDAAAAGGKKTKKRRRGGGKKTKKRRRGEGKKKKRRRGEGVEIGGERGGELVAEGAAAKKRKL